MSDRETRVISIDYQTNHAKQVWEDITIQTLVQSSVRSSVNTIEFLDKKRKKILGKLCRIPYICTEMSSEV